MVMATVPVQALVCLSRLLQSSSKPFCHGHFWRVKPSYVIEIYLNRDQVMLVFFIRVFIVLLWQLWLRTENFSKLSSKLLKRRNSFIWIGGVAVRLSEKLLPKKDSRKKLSGRRNSWSKGCKAPCLSIYGAQAQFPPGCNNWIAGQAIHRDQGVSPISP